MYELCFVAILMHHDQYDAGAIDDNAQIWKQLLAKKA